MKRSIGVLLSTISLLGWIGAARGAPVLDQNNDLLNGNPLNSALEWQQQVTAGIGGLLAGVELYDNFDNAPITLSIATGTAFTTGPFQFTEATTLSSGGTFIDTSAAGIILAPGEEFVIDLTGGQGCCDLYGDAVPYSGGDLFVNTGLVSDFTALSGISLPFQTYVDPIPEPAGVALFCLGLAGVAAIRRRRPTSTSRAGVGA